MTPSDLQQRIEAVLQKHLSPHSLVYASTVDDLAALYPTPPSWEVLERILDDCCHVDQKHCCRSNGLKERLLAWATGVPEEPPCDHRGLVSYEGEHMTQTQTGSNIRTNLQDLFGECPRCGQPRPEPR